MTEKRFTITGVGISDHEKKRLYDLQTVDGFISVRDELNALHEENQELKFENNELKCALALDEVEYIIAEGKKIDIPPYYEFEQRYDSVLHRREYDGYD